MGGGIAALCSQLTDASSGDLVLVNGKEEAHPEGAYYLEWRQGKNRIRVSVGKEC
jgi:hypothetical protein